MASPGGNPSFGWASDPRRSGARVRLSSTISSVADLPVVTTGLNMDLSPAVRRRGANCAPVDPGVEARVFDGPDETRGLRLEIYGTARL